MALGEDAVLPYRRLEDRSIDPSTPAAGSGLVYLKDGVLHSIDDAGAVIEYGAAGGSGAPTTAKYVTLEADATLSAEVAHPELVDGNAAGTDVDMSAAATGTSVTATPTSGLSLISFSAASWQYWDVASAIGTGDFDVRMRLTDLGPTGATVGSPLFGLMLTDGSRTQSTSLLCQIIGKGGTGSANVPNAQAKVNLANVGTAVGQITFPVIARIRRVGTTVTFLVSSNEGLMWYQLGATVTSSLNVGKVGAWMNPNTSTSGAALVHWIRTF